MSAVPVPGETLDRLLLDHDAADRALCERVAAMLRPLARDGVSLHLTIQVASNAITVKTDPPPRRHPVEGPRMRRQP